MQPHTSSAGSKMRAPNVLSMIVRSSLNEPITRTIGRPLPEAPHRSSGPGRIYFRAYHTSVASYLHAHVLPSLWAIQSEQRACMDAGLGARQVPCHAPPSKLPGMMSHCRAQHSSRNCGDHNLQHRCHQQLQAAMMAGDRMPQTKNSSTPDHAPVSSD